MNIDWKTEWLCANRISLNVCKTEFIIFRPPNMKLENRIVLKLNHTKLYESRKIKYLGLLIDDRLTWKYHINELCKNLNRTKSIFFKMCHFCPQSVLRWLYFSIFNSHVTCGVSVWGNANQIYADKLELLTKKAIRAITLAHFKTHSKPIIYDLQIAFIW